MLVEQSVYTNMLDEHGRKQEKRKKNVPARAGTMGSSAKPSAITASEKQLAKDVSKKRKAYAIAQGSKCGSASGEHNTLFSSDHAAIDAEAADEGIYSLVQAGTCCRKILQDIFENAPPAPIVPCCDICAPKLLDRMHPGVSTDAV